MMTKILLYGYRVGSVFLSADSEAPGGRHRIPCLGCRRSARFPDHIGFSETHLKAPEELFPAGVTRGVRGWERRTGKCGLGWREVKANASKHKATSCGRMEKTEKRLQEGVRELLKPAEAVGEIDFRKFEPRRIN